MTTQDFTFKSLLSSSSLPKLEEMSLVALATALLQEVEIKKIYYLHFTAKSVKKSMSYSNASKLRSLCKSVQLPDILELKLMSAFHYVMKEYFNWLKFVVDNLPTLGQMFPKKKDYITHIMNSVKWSNGVIDKKTSLHQVFIINDMQDDAMIEMFRTASRFCVEEDLKILWEKIPDTKKNEVFLKKDGKTCFFTLYWTCKMKEDMKDFVDCIHDYLKRRRCCKPVKDYKDPNYYALVLCIFEGDISGVKYYNKLANVDIECLELIVREFLQKNNRRLIDSWPNASIDDWSIGFKEAEKLLFLLKEIEDEGFLNSIFHEFFEAFLKISLKYWPWHKFFSIFVRMCSNSINYMVVYDLMIRLMEDVSIQKADIFQVKMLWKDIPSDVKGSFCVYISKHHKNRGDFIERMKQKRFWGQMSVELFDFFLKDEEIRNILTPYENHGILVCIYSGHYDLIELWLQKCLVSEEAIISYLENVIKTKTFAVIKTLQRHPLSRVNQFLDWAFKYEDLMSRDDIFKIKDEAISQDIVAMFVRGFKFRKWEDLKKLIDWMVRNRKQEYQVKLIFYKQLAIQEFFQKRVMNMLSNNDFKSSLLAFLNHGVNDLEKVKVMMSTVNVKEGEKCLEHLISDFNFTWINNYLKILEGYGKDIFLTKENIFRYVFINCNVVEFHKEKYCENIKKLLYWNCESDEEMGKKVEKIKKTIIEKYALQNILKCVRNKWDTAMNNILKFLFEGKMEDEEWSKMLFDLKMKAIEQEKSRNDAGKKEYYNMMLMLIKWGERNEDRERCYIESLKSIYK